jgi:hypothetical protein
MNLDTDDDFSSSLTTRLAFFWVGDKKEADDVRECLVGAFADRNQQVFREAVDRLAWLQFSKLFAVGVLGVLFIGVFVSVLGWQAHMVGLCVSLSGCIFMCLLSGLRLVAAKRHGRVQILAYRSTVYVAIAPIPVSLALSAF